MLSRSGYQLIEKIYQGRNSTIYRGVALTNNAQSVIIKIPLTKLPNTTGADKLRHEFKLRQRVTSKYIVNYLALLTDTTYGVILIEEDDQADVLTDHIPSQGLETKAFLKIAIQLAKGLKAIHQGNVIHKDIKSSNIIIQPETGQIKYLDLGSASLLRQPKQVAINLIISEGTLAYISPEQTGRINRQIDYRTDFYSLGVTFYQLLCGQLPFTAQQPLELIHCHIAQQPKPPCEVKPSIPAPLSDIIIKLLKKDADDRYQSAQGLLHDLQICWNKLQTEREIPSFLLAQQDFSEYFYIPQKLYGREQELPVLTEAFHRTCQGNSEVCLIAGSAGVGKSALVNDFQPIIAAQNGLFLAGKFEQLNRNTAYSAITQAFQAWIKQLLVQSEEEILYWKTQWLAALNNQGQIIIDMIPEVEFIIGKQPPVPLLETEPAKNRFHLVFQNFIRVIAALEHPLVLFLDDWQWADSASLHLIETLMIGSKTQPILLVGAYRDNEINSLHPMLDLLEAFKKANVPIHTLNLSPLNSISINQWMADAMHTSPELALPLTELMVQKTAGNPFFIKAFLQIIYEAGLIIQNEQGNWQWDLNRIRQHPATDNVIELMTHKIKQFSLATQDSLKFASCLGHQFTLATLQIITQKTDEQLIAELQPAIDSGFILQIENVFKFAHDRVQEAAHRLISDEKRAETHYIIGHLLQANLPVKPTFEQLSEAIDHLNQGLAYITDKNERLELAKLNLEVSNNAKQAIAYADALHYLQVVENCLVQIDIWQESYSWAFDFYKELADVEYLNQHFESSATYLDTLLTHAQTVTEKVAIYNLRIAHLTSRSHYQDAVDTGYQALRLLEIEWLSQDLQVLLRNELGQVQRHLKTKTMEMLLNAPDMINSNIQTIVKLLYHLIVPAHFCNPTLFELVIIKVVNLSLCYGNTAESAKGYATYGMLLITKWGNIPLGYEFGLLALQLSDRFHNLAIQCRVNMLYANFIHHWLKPLAQVETFINRGQQAGLAAGEFQFLGYLSLCKATYFFYKGTPLATLEIELTKLLQAPYNRSNQMVVSMIHAVQLVVLNLTGQTSKETIFENTIKTDIDYQVDWQREQNFEVLFNYLTLKAQTLYLYGHNELALETILAAKGLSPMMVGYIAVAAYNFYYSLILIALYPTADSTIQQDYWQQLESNQSQLKTWSHHCPENFKHQYLLVAAEIARVSNNNWEATELYKQSIDCANQQGFIQEAALAYELAAKFWLGKNQSEYAQGCLSKAYSSYLTWGAKKKVALLKSQYTDLLELATPTNLSNFAISSETTISSHSLRLLDLASVLKASQAISSDIKLSKLLFTIMKVIIETAGAQKGAFLLEESGEFWVQAEYTIDGQIYTLQHLPLADWGNGAQAIVNYVKRTQQAILLANASTNNSFSQDTYIRKHHIQSVCCLPIIRQNQLKSILYIENNLAPQSFTEQHLQVLSILASQMAISLENVHYIQKQLQTSQQVAEAHCRRAEEAERYQKEQEDFIDMVCHEIRNPIMGVLGNIDFLKQNAASLNAMQESLPVPHQLTLKEFLQKQAENIQGIEQCILHQKTVMDNVIDLSRLESGKLILTSQPFYPKTIIEEVIKYYTTLLAAKKLALVISLPESGSFVKGDVERLKSVLSNLMAYVIKSTEQGTIKVSLISKIKANQTTLKIRIEDTGSGMTFEEQSQLFQRFAKSASAGYESSRLGLIMSKRLIERMGGQLSITSEKGIGTQWKIQLPCESISPQESLALLAEKKPPSPQLTLAGKYILIIEDNQMNQKILSRHLQQAGHRFVVANHGQEAVEACEQNTFDLILMDIEMPIMNGIEATKRIRKREKQLNRAQTPIIALSAYEYQQQALEAGMNDYMTKPYSKDVLNQKIKHWTAKLKTTDTSTLTLPLLTPTFFIRSPITPSSTEFSETLTHSKTDTSTSKEFTII